jgi:hypothetical protein
MPGQAQRGAEVLHQPLRNPALEASRWSVPRPGRFTPAKDAVPIVQASVDGTENVAFTRIRSPDCPISRYTSYFRVPLANFNS